MECVMVSDNKLVKDVQDGVNVNENMAELIERHSNIFYKMVHKYFYSDEYSMSSFGVKKRDVLDSVGSVIYDAVINYDFNAGTKVSTHIGNQSRFFCLHQINAGQKHVLNNSMQKHLAQEIDLTDDHDCYKIDNSMVEWAIKILKEMPDDRVWQVFKLRYFGSESGPAKTWNEISNFIKDKKGDRNISNQACINLHEKGIREIQKKIKKSKDKVDGSWVFK